MAATFFFSVGEPSGDLHGANLIRELRSQQPDLQCVGYGGPLMSDAGCELHEDLTQFAVMWIARVIVNLHRFIGLLIRANRYFREERPDAVILIDYPGFNWWIARRATAHGIPVYYYGTPQIWAWAPWRVKKMKRFVDHVLCKLPFEPDWFKSRGCHATYVGHPYFDELATRKLDGDFLRDLGAETGLLVTLLPGSRNQEVATHLPRFLEVVGAIQSNPSTADLRFAIASFSPTQSDTAQQMLAEANLPQPERVSVHVHRTPELIEAATACLACSGSVSLELLYHAKPTVILYQIGRWAFRLQDRFRIAKYITLVNLLATENIERRPGEHYDPDALDNESVPMPEYLTSENRTGEIARRIENLLNDTTERQAAISRLESLREQYGTPGASRRAADYILSTLTESGDSGQENQGASHPAIPAPKLIHQAKRAKSQHIA